MSKDDDFEKLVREQLANGVKEIRVPTKAQQLGHILTETVTLRSRLLKGIKLAENLQNSKGVYIQLAPRVRALRKCLELVDEVVIAALDVDAALRGSAMFSDLEDELIAARRQVEALRP